VSELTSNTAGPNTAGPNTAGSNTAAQTKNAPMNAGDGAPHFAADAAGIMPPTGGAFPSTVLERYLSRDSHGAGMVFEITFQLSDPPDVQALKAAWETVVRRHPRLHAKLIGRGNRQRWVPGDIDLDKFFCRICSEPDQTNRRDLPAPNVRRGIGGVLLVCSHPDHPALQFRFHHGACDGVGAGRIIGDFFRSLHQIDDQRPKVVRSGSDAGESLEHQLDSPKHIPQSPLQLPDLRHAWTTLRGRNVDYSKHIVPCAGPATEKTPQVSRDPQRPLDCIGDDLLTFQMDSSSSAALRRRLRSEQIPLNDFAVAATLLSLANLSRQVAGERMRVMVVNPVQLRSWKQRRSSANHLGFAFVRRRHRELLPEAIESQVDAFRSVHQELQAVRSLGISTELMWGVAALERVPGAVRLFERSGRFRPTASVTCLSSIQYARRYGFPNGPRIGDSEIRRFAISAPLQHDGQLAVCVWELNGSIGWSFRVAQPAWRSSADAVARGIESVCNRLAAGLLL